jgi:tetraacyldisaccharide 4'-kinase
VTALTSAGNPLRQALWPLGLLYGGVAAVRNWTFTAGLRAVHRLPVPVLSVGNLTVGGTGKTPTTAWLCELARARGRRPGVLARGYGRAPGAALNDEGMMLQRRLPWLLQEQDPDRVQGGQRLCAKGADFVVLDDGLQHRRLHRDRDLVCLDATLPFGNGHCLPAGDLREFRGGLRRAGIVLLTRAGGLPTEALLARVRKVHELAGAAVPVYATEHAPCGLRRQPDGAELPLTALAGQRVVLLSAIARPESFRATVAELGAEVVGDLRHRDHHRFRAAELEQAQRTAAAAGAWLVTTEKDDARLGGIGLVRHVLQVALRFLDAPPSPAEVLL